MHLRFLADRLRAGETVFCGWSALTDPLAAEAMARTGFDAVCLDMQHGFHDVQSLRGGLTGIVAAGAAPVLRVPFGGLPEVGRGLDLGFEVVICPMIDSESDAIAFARAAKYPPLGGRSWGPARAMMLTGSSKEAFLQTANRRTLAFAMVETREALGQLDRILAVEGIDGVFVGPSDLSISLAQGASIGPGVEGLAEAIKMVAQRAAAHGRIAGAFAQTREDALAYAAAGYRFIATGPDLQLLAAAAADLIRSLRNPT